LTIDSVAGRMLATDLDGTFIGDDRAMEMLWRELDELGVAVVFSTGRHLPAIYDFYETAATDRRAAACITMVGTEIWHRSGDGYLLDDGWSDHIAAAWDRREVDAVVGAVPGVERQPEEWQSPFKASYFVDDLAPVVVDGIHALLAERGLDAKVVYSAGRFLDLLPLRSGKGEAVVYLADELELARGDVVTAGDTGNDLDMMRPELGVRSIAVGNATAELRDFVAPNVYHAKADHAAGIREGLEYYGWLTPA
jgi:sucrose-6F-phosphate phosphohydrolase